MAVALLARQRVREAREILKHDRVAALAELEEIFQTGTAPESLLDGRFSGQIITTTFQPAINTLVHFLMHTVLPWKGTSFDVETGTGSNIIAYKLGSLLHLITLRRGQAPTNTPDRFQAFKFNSHIESSLDYPDQEVLVADYCTESNPVLLRRLIAEIVEIGDGYYLGRLLVNQYPCRWVCRAYFTLSELPEAIGQPWLEQVA